MITTALQKAKTDPVALARALWNQELWEGGRAILEAVARNSRVVVIGANGVGKSHAISLAVMHYFLTRSRAMAIITSASWGQLQRGLWRYTSSLARRITLLRIVQDRIEYRDRWIWAVSTNAKERLQGLHGEHVLVVVDEGSGVPDWLPEVIIAMSPEKVVISGNPLEPRGPLWEAWNDPHYTRLAISALDFPNVKEGRIVFPGGITRETINEVITRYGEDSPVYQARVLGQFPENLENIVIPWSIISIATQRELVAAGEAVIGVDVARGGEDRTAVAVIRGNSVSRIETWQIPDLMATTGKIIALWEQEGRPQIVVDETGLGGGVVDRLREQNIPVRGVNFGAGAVRGDRFANMRAELWWTLREALQEWLAIPDNRELHDDLMSVRYGFDSRGRIKLEPKSELARSPDIGDALALAVWGRASKGAAQTWLEVLEKLR